MIFIEQLGRLMFEHWPVRRCPDLEVRQPLVAVKVAVPQEAKAIRKVVEGAIELYLSFGGWSETLSVDFDGGVRHARTRVGPVDGSSDIHGHSRAAVDDQRKRRGRALAGQLSRKDVRAQAQLHLVFLRPHVVGNVFGLLACASRKVEGRKCERARSDSNDPFCKRSPPTQPRPKSTARNYRRHAQQHILSLDPTPDATPCLRRAEAASGRLRVHQKPLAPRLRLARTAKVGKNLAHLRLGRGLQKPTSEPALEQLSPPQAQTAGGDDRASGEPVERSTIICEPEAGHVERRLVDTE